MFSFFSSPFWRDVEQQLAAAPQWLRDGSLRQVLDRNVARRLLEDRLRCIREACDRADRETARQLGGMLGSLEIESILAGLLDTLKEVVLIVGGGVGLGAVAGAGIGSLFGGIGAVPGAAIGAALGAKAGMFVLTVLGLEALAEFFLDGLPGILQSYYQGFSLAWQAGHDDVAGDPLRNRIERSSRIAVASGHIAAGHVAMVMLLLSAIVAYLTRGRGDIQALAGQARRGRLGERFAAWMVKHEEALRKHPRLQEKSRRPSASGGGAAPPPPPRPPRRGDRDGESEGPPRMPHKRIRCFETNDLPHAKVPEFDRQLKGQEKGLNEMTVDEYLKGREAFGNGQVTRNPKTAREARAERQDELTQDLIRLLQGQGVPPRQAEQQAAAAARKQMETLAALHTPDMVAAGKDVISDFGDRSVNSRIGAQWNAGNNSRLAELDKAASAVPEALRRSMKMDVGLERCQ